MGDVGIHEQVEHRLTVTDASLRVGLDEPDDGLDDRAGFVNVAAIARHRVDQPILAPIGVVGSLAAREVIVSTLAQVSAPGWRS